MDRIIQSPGKYIQGADVLTRLGDYLKPIAERWLIVGDKFVLGFAEKTLRESLDSFGGFQCLTAANTQHRLIFCAHGDVA